MLQFTYNGEMRMFIGFETIFYPQQGCNLDTVDTLREKETYVAKK